MTFMPLKFVNFNENLHCSNKRRYDVTSSGRECYVSHIYNMTLSTITVTSYDKYTFKYALVIRGMNV